MEAFISPGRRNGAASVAAPAAPLGQQAPGLAGQQPVGRAPPPGLTTPRLPSAPGPHSTLNANAPVFSPNQPPRMPQPAQPPRPHAHAAHGAYTPPAPHPAMGPRPGGPPVAYPQMNDRLAVASTSAANAPMHHAAAGLGFNPNAPAFVPGGQSARDDKAEGSVQVPQTYPRCSFCGTQCGPNYIKVYYSAQNYAPLCSAECWQSWVKDKLTQFTLISP